MRRKRGTGRIHSMKQILPHAGSRPVMSEKNSQQNGHVRDAVGGKHTQPVLHRCGAILEKSNEQHRRDADNFPSGDEQIHRGGRENEQGSKREQVQQEKEPIKTRIPVQIAN